MLIIISDASVLIDIEQGELTNAMFELPWQFIVPDILFAEELKQQHSCLIQFGLISKVMDSHLISEAYKLRQNYKQTSMNDLLALVLAKHEKSRLLTGDKALRQLAVKLNVEVHGTLWLVNQMIQRKKITMDTARIGFQRMRQSGSRLPWDEIERMLQEQSYLTNVKIPMEL